MSDTTKDAVPGAAILPDGSAFAVLSLPLPADHWIYAERTYSKHDQVEPDDLPAPIFTHAMRAAVVAAVRYAVRGATMCGKEPDFDPDALVQNAVYALCGPYGIDEPANDWRADVEKVRDALDPEDWCGDESMIDALNRALDSCAPAQVQAEAVRVDDALIRELLETLQMMVLHFTKTPSTLADSKARGKAHEVITKAYAQIGYAASSTGDQS